MADRKAFADAKRDIATAHETGGDLCGPLLSVLPVTGAAVSVLSGPAGQSTVCASDATVARLDELQFDLGEGPCWSALSTRRPVLQADLLNGGSQFWPHFTSAVRDDAVTGTVGAVFAFPLMVGSLDIGAVEFYSPDRTALDRNAVAAASALSRLIAWQVLRRALTPPSDVGDEGTYSRREVHQATGMVLAQLGISAENAELLLRAHAFSTGRPVRDVATDVIERRLDFSEDGTR